MRFSATARGGWIRGLGRAILMALLWGGCTSVPAFPTTQAPTAEPSATDFVTPMPSVRAEPSPTPTPCFTREDLAAMPLAEVASMPQVCYRSLEGVETRIDQAQALSAIADFLQDKSRRVAFREITRMANSPDGLLHVARFVDEDGRSYLVAVAAHRVVEMDPGPMTARAQAPPLSPKELQALAEAFILREMPEFADLRSRLTFTQGEKSGEFFFFRYESSEGGPWMGLPPLAQVGLTADGQVFSYLNTLYFLL